MNYGYARVSTPTQNLQRQIDALHDYGLDDQHILFDKASGKDFNRQSYNLLVGTDKTAPLLRSGDCLIITDLDRLGRNYREIIDQWRHLTDLGVCIRVLEIPLLTIAITDTNLENNFISDLVLQILSYVAEKERSYIKSRQKQGIISAKASGKKFGRPVAQYPSNWDDVYADWQSGKIRAVEAIRITGLTRCTFYNLARRYEEEHNLNRQIVYGKRYFVDEIKLDGITPTPEFQAAAKREREGTLQPGDMQILLNPGYQIKEEER